MGSMLNVYCLLQDPAVVMCIERLGGAVVAPHDLPSSSRVVILTQSPADASTSVSTANLAYNSFLVSHAHHGYGCLSTSTRSQRC